MGKPISINARVFIDVVVILLVGSVPAALNWGKVTPFQRGFYCDDESVRYPYRSDTVTTTMLFVFVIVFPAVVMIVSETITHFVPRSRRPNFKRFGFFCIAIHPCVFDIGFFYLMYIFGTLVNQAITDIGKYSIGRMRPHFVSACQPDIDLSTCTVGQYLTNFTCMETDSYKKTNARLSFPSGHSSLAAYSMLYVAYYAQVRFPKWGHSILLKHLLQFICVALAWYCGLSRISDYKHHWSDVLVGFLIGSIVGLAVVVCTTNNFKEPSIPVAENDDSQEVPEVHVTKPGSSPDPASNAMATM